jgi:hypothetical protein
MEEAKKQKRLWVGGLLGLTTVLAVGYGVFWMGKGGVATRGKKSESSWGLGWMRSTLTGIFAWNADVGSSSASIEIRTHVVE